MNTTTILLCGITNNGNVAATNEAKTERFILAKNGEILTGSHLQFPDHILQDRVTGTKEYPTAEAMIRQYAAQKSAELALKKKEEKSLEAQAAEALIHRFGSLEAANKGCIAYREIVWKKEKYVEPTIKALRAALKKAEASAAKKAAKEKEMAAWKKICEKALASLKGKAPAAPLKGLGYAREDFPTIGNNKKMQVLFAAIPASHKDEIASRRQKGYFSWSEVISPEASAKIAKLLPLAQ